MNLSQRRLATRHSDASSHAVGHVINCASYVRLSEPVLAAFTALHDSIDGYRGESISNVSEVNVIAKIISWYVREQ